jgi:hypothetical protein
MRSVFRFFLTRFEHIHIIRKIYIDKTTREVLVMRKNSKEKVLKVHKADYAEEFKVDEEIYDQICEIVSKQKE